MTLGRKLYNIAAFQAGWFACVLGAARGNTWIGPVVVAVVLVIHLVVARERRGEWKLLAASLPIGLAVNTALQSTNTVVAPGPPTGPLWLLALWPLFATLFGESTSWMRGRYVLGCVFASFGAPLSYWAGEGAGALDLDARPLPIALVAITWSGAIAALLACQARFTARTPPRDRSSG